MAVYAGPIANNESASVFRATGSDAQAQAAFSSQPQQYQVGGWYNGQQWNGSSFGQPGQVIVGNNNSSSGSSTPSFQAPSQQDLDSIYNPIMSDLSNRESTLRNTDYPTAVSNIDLEGNQLTGDLDLQNQQQKTLTDSQQQTLSTEQQSAYDQAVRGFNAAKNAAVALYGGGNSASGAFTDLAAAEYNRALGSIGSSYTTSLGNLLGQQEQVFQYVAQKKADVGQWVAEQKQSAYQTFMDNLAHIDSLRFSAQSDKAKAQYQALQALDNSVNQLQLQQFQAQQALDTWKQQQSTLYQNQLAQMRSSAVDFATQNPFSTQQNQFNQTTVSSSPQGQQQLFSGGFLPGQQNKDDLNQQLFA